LHLSHSQFKKSFGAQPQTPNEEGHGQSPDPNPARPLSVFLDLRLFSINHFICWKYMAWHVDIQRILLLALHNKTPRACAQPPTEDTAFSTSMLLVVLNFNQSSVKYTLQNTENYCHQWLSGSSRVHQANSFSVGLRPEPHWWSLLRSIRPSSRLGTGIPPPHTPTTKAARSLRLWCSFGSNRHLPRPPTNSLSQD